MSYKTTFTKLKEKVGGIKLLIIFIIVILISYNSYSTRWISPTQKINVTGAYNLTVEIDGIYSYVFNQYIPKEKDFEYENFQIPRGSFEFGEALLIILFLTSLVLMGTYEKETTKDPLPYNEILEKAKEYLDLLKKEGMLKEYKLPQGALNKTKQIDNGDKIPDTWHIPVETTTPDGEAQYRLLGFNPFTGKLKEDLKIKKEFKGEDKCPECGKFAHQKIITPAGYKIWEEQFSTSKK